MVYIPLTQGQVALIDNEDYPIISLFKWYAHKHRNTYYARTNIRVNGLHLNIKMHRLIMNAKKGQILDHFDMSGLNNQKSNLRYCTLSQSAAHRSKFKDCTSPYKGASFSSGRWIAQIRKDNVLIHLGTFKTEVEAHERYKVEAIKLFGEFARVV